MSKERNAAHSRTHVDHRAVTCILVILCLVVMVPCDGKTARGCSFSYRGITHLASSSARGFVFFMSTGVLLPHTAPEEWRDAQENGTPAVASTPQPEDPHPQGPQAPASFVYDPAIFHEPIPRDQLSFLNQFAGATTKDVFRDKQFRKLIHSVTPDCVFHYGWDMSLYDAVQTVEKNSPLPVQIRDGRYLTVSGRSGPYLAGRGLIWIDLQDGIALGGFYFHPTNGEPTPTVNVFSKQVSAEILAMSQLPPAFAADLSRWSAESRVPAITTRYFITSSRKKILLEHDEEYCAPGEGRTPAPPDVCLQADAQAADLDLDAALYLEQTHHATNATAWMINDQDQVTWLQVRNSTCGIGPDSLGCRIRMTRERTRGVIHPHSAPHPPHR